MKYGPDFFGNNACLCRTCEQENTEALEQNIKYHILLDELCFEILQQIVEESIAQSLETTRSVSGSKKRRIKGRELVEVFNEFTEDPLDSELLQENTSVVFKKLFLGSSVIDVPSFDEVCDENDSQRQLVELSFVDVDLETPQSDKISFDDDQTLLSSTESSPDNVQQFAVLRASSPVLFNESFSFSLSSIGGESSTESLVTPALRPTVENLSNGSDVTVQEASVLTDLFCSKFNCSDECAESLHSLVRVLLPSDNKFPSGYSHVNGMKKQFEDEVRVLNKTENFTICVMTFRFQIRDIFK